jgi:hypothetical protein
VVFHTSQDSNYHVLKGKRNKTFYDEKALESSNYKEWAIVVLFYAAMHSIDAVLSQDTNLYEEYRDPPDHTTRNIAVTRCTKLNNISHKYLQLYQRSLNARYEQF